jgi:hypothetical protein
MAAASPTPQAEPHAISAWEAMEEVMHTVRQLAQLGRQHRRVRHKQRRR